MIITRLELENIKSYKHTIIDFQRGTTAISGTNGAGKTTLVEAIGFALFDSMPYKQDQFVREGEKYGRVVVHLLGNDDRPYEVERRCGAGASWTLYDREANFRVEQRADVQDRLHELFGIERERLLESLFRDALGVPQGTFTSIFLQKPSARKQTFDSLLQIEDYRTAADYLLEAQKQYREQQSEQEREIQRLTFETRDLDTWREALQTSRREDQDLKERNLRGTQRLEERRTYAARLKKRREMLLHCETERTYARIQCENAHEQLAQAERALQEAQSAHQMVEASQPDYQRYRQAEAELARLRREESQRNAVREQYAQLNNTYATTQANLRHIQQRLTEVEEAQQRILALMPEVERQSELDAQIATLTLEVQQYETLRKEGNRLYQLREKSQRDLEAVRSAIATRAPLQAVANLHNERLAAFAQLQAHSEQRQARRLQLAEKEQHLQEKQNELTQALAKLNKAERALAKIEMHRAEGEEYAGLLLRCSELERQQHHLRGNIESYTDSRNRSAGGQCPLLHQTCLNLQRQGQLSLEAYFDGLLTEERTQLAEIEQELATLAQRGAAIQKHAEALEKLGQYVEQRDGSAERIERLNVEIRRQEREVSRLQQEWEGLQHIEQEISQAEERLAESKEADRQARELPGLMTRAESIQEQIEQYSAEFEERRREAEPLKGCKEQLEESRKALAALNDPRAHSRAAQEIIRPQASYRQQQEDAQEALALAARQRDELQGRLDTYTYLDRALDEQARTRAQAEAGHQRYMQNEKVAATVPARTVACESAQQRAAQAGQDLLHAEQAYQQAAAHFDEQEYSAVEAEIKDLEQEITTLANNMQHVQVAINEYEQKIAAAEILLQELESAQQEKRTLEELTGMMEQFRKLIKEAAPQVLHAMLSDISAEANRIFGEIMGDRSAQLSWSDDYEISLLRQGVKRSFAQLSGGEQMSAALAVRLALLKKLSALNLAFFDEPTQNMDEQRRTNLAEQIRRVRGFDQLLVISHDDTFEQGLDSLIRLRKQDGVTRRVSEDDAEAASASLEEQVPYAS
ncbi:MAG TPA: SMC family ATPase [Ktedonobacteraceae bacterium]|jgi:exonuclease SbcC